MNMQNNQGPSPQNITSQNVQAANAKYQQEFANSELAQAPGQISKMLLAGAQAGFEFGNMGGNMANNLANKGNLNPNATYEFGNLNNTPNMAMANANKANANARYEFGNMNNNAAMANANMNQNSELNQSTGQMSQILRNQS